MKIAVYLAAHSGTHPAIEEAVKEVGHYLGEQGHELVYGGSNCGLMGELAQSVKESGGKVVGIQLQSIHQAGRTYDGLDELRLLPTLAERKAAMMDLSDAFLIFPGGIGTLDEATDIQSVNKLSPSPKPVIILNLDSFYDEYEHQLNKMVSFGFLTEAERKQTTFVTSVDELKKVLKQ